ncbi:probable G-protein coupled receptor 139 [Heptranchias perlo]|uniref:probable G-protein coupled receptor 139 n=1 Tax=Heptranchias perlo TaxID=212740 RepID=UPI003559D670
MTLVEDIRKDIKTCTMDKKEIVDKQDQRSFDKTGPDGLHPCIFKEATGEMEKYKTLVAVYPFHLFVNQTHQQDHLSEKMGWPVTVQIEAICYPILALIGVPANLMTIVILSRGKCGLSKCITRYLVAMATADLLVMIFDVILYAINDIYFPYSFLNYTCVCRINLSLIYFVIDCSVWLTVTFTLDRFVAICCRNLRTKYCTEKTAALVIVTVCGLSFLENLPIYFMFEPSEIIDNTSWFCNVQSNFYTSPAWIAYLWLDSILTPFAPFVLIFLLNALTIRHILAANIIRRGLQGNNGENQNDPEMRNRRKSIILLLAISGNFVLLWMLTLMYYMCVQIADSQFLQTDYTDSFTSMEKAGYLLQRFSSCSNTIIYAVAQTKFREELMNTVKSPFTLIIKLMKH